MGGHVTDNESTNEPSGVIRAFDVDTQRIGVGPKVQAPVRDATIEQRVAVAPHVEQMADVERMYLDVPRATHRIRQLAD